MLVAVEKVEVEGVKTLFSLFRRVGWEAFDFFGQKRVTKRPPADHPAVNGRETGGKSVEGGKIGNIPVIDQRVTAELLADGKTIGVGIAFVELFA